MLSCGAGETKPTDGSTQWSPRSLAAATGISKTTVHRWRQTFLCAAALVEALQAVDGSLLCREDSRHRRPVSESARQGDGALR
jgi:hypothetical protein